MRLDAQNLKIVGLPEYLLECSVFGLEHRSRVLAGHQIVESKMNP